MRIPRQSRKIIEGIRPGFKDADCKHLDEVNPTRVREAQLIDDYKEDNNRNLCSLCSSNMQYFKESEELVCTHIRCGNVVSTVSNTPLSKTDQSMHPFSSQHYDPNLPEDEPFFASWNPDSQYNGEGKDYQVTYSSSDGRVKKIKYNGYPRDISFHAFDD